MLQLTDLIQQGDFTKRDDESQEEYFRVMAKELEAKGFVKKGFLTELNRREKNYPTGIETKTQGVAMPHVESQYVLTNALFIAVFKEPIKFRRMDDSGKELDVKLVFMLLVEDTSIHMEAIQQLAKLFIDEDILNKLLECEDKDEVLDLIRKYQGGQS